MNRELERLMAAMQTEAWTRWTNEERELVMALYEMGYTDVRQLPDGRFIALFRMLFSHSLCYGLDRVGMQGRYCYGTVTEAYQASIEWDGNGHPPLNWIKHKGLGVDERNPQQEQDNAEL